MNHQFKVGTTPKPEHTQSTPTVAGTPPPPAKMASAPKKSLTDAPSGREYKYSQEISQMMFVFGEVQDPNPETVNLVEDIVRSQLIELVSRMWVCSDGLA